MRKLQGHKVNPADDQISIIVQDDPDDGGDCNIYEIQIRPKSKGYYNGRVVLRFQHGPISENGVNGITQEVLLAILIDRLQSFQSGDYRCRENEIALTKMEGAQLWLHYRTRDRMARGVEGTHEL